MNKSKLVAQIASKSNLSKKASETALNSLMDVITKELKSGGDISLVGFGSFSVQDRAARVGRNPQTGEEIQIKAAKNPVFKAGKGLKDAVNT